MNTICLLLAQTIKGSLNPPKNYERYAWSMCHILLAFPIIFQPPSWSVKSLRTDPPQIRSDKKTYIFCAPIVILILCLDGNAELWYKWALQQNQHVLKCNLIYRTVHGTQKNLLHELIHDVYLLYILFQPTKGINMKQRKDNCYTSTSYFAWYHHFYSQTPFLSPRNSLMQKLKTKDIYMLKYTTPAICCSYTLNNTCSYTWARPTRHALFLNNLFQLHYPRHVSNK